MSIAQHATLGHGQTECPTRSNMMDILGFYIGYISLRGTHVSPLNLYLLRSVSQSLHESGIVVDAGDFPQYQGEAYRKLKLIFVKKFIFC